MKFKKITTLLIVLVLFSCKKDEEVSSALEVNLDLKAIRSLVNQHRLSGAACGTEQVSPATELAWDDALAQAALTHSNDMQINDYFSHTGQNGSSFSERVTDAGFSGTPVGENIAKGYVSEEDVIAGWMESEGHCSNIMNGSATHIGVARSNEGSLWTMVLGRK